MMKKPVQAREEIAYNSSICRGGMMIINVVDREVPFPLPHKGKSRVTNLIWI